MIKKPIIFIGAPRSGTTIIFEAFSVHEDLAWFSNILARFPMLPIISVLSRITNINILRGMKKQNIKNKPFIKKIFPYPDEGYSIWERYCGSEFKFNYMIDRTAKEHERNKLTKYINRVMRYHGKKRFAMKITGPARIGYLNSLFPDARFIHIIRDGRAVGNSLMNVDFWREGGGYKKPWWKNGLTNKDLELYEQYKKDPLALAVIQWRRIIKTAREEASAISRQRYMEVRYEDFLTNREDRIYEMQEYVELPICENVIDYMKKRMIFRNMNYKYLETMKKTDIEMVNNIAGTLLSELGYDI